MNLTLAFPVTAVLLLGLTLAARAADPAAIPPATTPEPAAGPASAAAPSAWLSSFPAERRRPLAGYPGADVLLLWPPIAAWRGDVLLLPGQGNSSRAASLLLPLADRLALAGWRCWLLPREQPGLLPAEANLSSVLALIKSEPAPTSRAEGVNKPGLFLIAEADAASFALASNHQQTSTVAGTVLLTPTFTAEAETEPPTQPVLEVDRQPTTPAQHQARLNRSQHWAQQANYQFHAWVLPAQSDASQWLARIIDGWLRKTSLAAEQVAGDNEQKKKMTAQTNATTP